MDPATFELLQLLHSESGGRLHVYVMKCATLRMRLLTRSSVKGVLDASAARVQDMSQLCALLGRLVQVRNWDEVDMLLAVYRPKRDDALLEDVGDVPDCLLAPGEPVNYPISPRLIAVPAVASVDTTVPSVRAVCPVSP